MQRYFYMLFSVWSAIMVILGFWPSYVGYLVRGSLETQVIIHIHAVMFSGWIILFFVQSYWISRNQITTHMKWGKAGIYYGILVMITGLVTALVRGDYHSDMGNDAAAFFSRTAGTRDIVIFGVLFGVAMIKRKQPLSHKIWILGACAYLLVPAVSRANGFLFHGNRVSFYLLWLLPFIIAMMIDFSNKNPYRWQYLVILIIMVVSVETLELLRLLFLG